MTSPVTVAALESVRRGACRLPILLLLSACGQGGDREAAPVPVAQVRTVVLADADLTQTAVVYGVAEIAPGGERTLAAPVDATIAAVLTAPGARVVAGQPLIRLTPTAQTRLDLVKARQDAHTADEAYARAGRLRPDGLASDADLEAARSAAAIAGAQLAGLQARAAAPLVRAPIAGVIETLTAVPGDLAAAGASLGRLGPAKATQVRLGVDARTAAAVAVGASVKLQPLAGGPASPGRVLAVDPRPDAQTRLSSVVVGDVGGLPAPGAAVRGDIALRHAHGVVAPRGALYYEQDQAYVLVADGGVVRRRDVKLGAEQDDRVEIVDGVAAGQRIVVDGGASLEDGAAVREAAPTTPEKLKANAGA